VRSDGGGNCLSAVTVGGAADNGELLVADVVASVGPPLCCKCKSRSSLANLSLSA